MKGRVSDEMGMCECERMCEKKRHDEKKEGKDERKLDRWGWTDGGRNRERDESGT